MYPILNSHTRICFWNSTSVCPCLFCYRITVVIITASLYCAPSCSSDMMALLLATMPLVRERGRQAGQVPSLDSQVPATRKYCSALGNSTEDFRERHSHKESENKAWVVCACDWGRWGGGELIHELPLHHVILLSVHLHGDARLPLCPLWCGRGFYF